MLSAQGYKRKRMGMASFLDVIFLLLFYVIMTTTFSRFGEVTLTSAGAGQAAAAASAAGQSDAPKPYFLQLGLEDLKLNGAVLEVQDLRGALEQSEEGTRVLIKLAPEVTAQRLTDLLVVLNGLPALTATVLE